MAASHKSDAKKAPITSGDEVRHLADPIADHAVAEIVGLLPSLEEFEVAVAYARGEGDIAGVEGHGLSGKTALVYEILLADEVYQAEVPGSE